MPTEKHVLDLLPAYVLGSLDESEAGRVGAHLAGCGRCRRELHAYQEVMDALGAAVPRAEPPRELKRRLLQQARRSRQPGQGPVRPALRPWTVPAWGIAGLALLLVLAAVLPFAWRGFGRPEVLTGPQGMRAVALRSSEVLAAAGGIVIISADGANGVLVVDRLPQLPEGQQYQVWLYQDGESTSGPAFTVDESGYRGVRIQAPQSLLAYRSIQVTVEPDGGSASPSGEVVLEGSLHNP